VPKPTTKTAPDLLRRWCPNRPPRLTYLGDRRVRRFRARCPPERRPLRIDRSPVVGAINRIKPSLALKRDSELKRTHREVWDGSVAPEDKLGAIYYPGSSVWHQRDLSPGPCDILPGAAVPLENAKAMGWKAVVTDDPC
jgi:hypothetical protein